MDMSVLGYIIVFTLIGSVVSLILGLILLSTKKLSALLEKFALSFAAGALLAAVFLDLFIEGAHDGHIEPMMYAALAGIVLFFMAERGIRWFHHHHQHEHSNPGVPLLVIGDTIHNILDGIAIAAAFLISIPTGIVTTIAVAAHEIPQEVGEFGALLAKGVRRRRIIVLNIISSLGALVAAVVTYFVGQSNALPLEVIFGLSAGFLLYVALSDLIPSLHEQHNKKRLFDLQLLFLFLGIATVAVATHLVHG